MPWAELGSALLHPRRQAVYSPPFSVSIAAQVISTATFGRQRTREYKTSLQADPFQMPQALEHAMRWPHSLPLYHWQFPRPAQGAHSTWTLHFTLPQP